MLAIALLLSLIKRTKIRLFNNNITGIIPSVLSNLRLKKQLGQRDLEKLFVSLTLGFVSYILFANKYKKLNEIRFDIVLFARKNDI